MKFQIGLNQNMQNKKTTQDNKHEFAFFYKYLSDILHEDIDIAIACDDLYHRFKHVLRIKQDDTVIIFNQKERIIFTFAKFEGKNKITGTWSERQLNQSLTPTITFLLPLLKIDALSDAVYSLTEVGITNIQLISTKKTQTPCTPKLLEKLERVAVAAAEQSKDFAYPTILPPVQLADWLAEKREGEKFHFDVTGLPFSQWRTAIDPQQHYYLLVGPEGDLTDDEKSLAKASGFKACLLTPTVLRSTRAISLVSGIFRL